MFEPLVVAVWAMLPAYVPNNAAVVLGGGRPIDGGRVWNGARLLGAGKTWRGTVGGILVGMLLAVGLNAARPVAVGAFGEIVPAFSATAVVALPTGAMAGDVAASFLKRRAGHNRGESVPVLDQLDFVVGALALVAVAAPSWFLATFTPVVIAVVVVITPLLHVGTNAAAYGLGLKSEPW